MLLGCPALQSRINVDWLTFDPQMCSPLFPEEGIFQDVFVQKAVAVWDHAPSDRIMVSLLLPGPMEADQWLHDVRTSRNMWPLQKTSHVMANQLATETFMRRERRRLQARHIWEKIEPNWPMIEERVSGPNKLQASHTKRFLGASFSMITRKNLGGWRIRTETALPLDPTAETLAGMVCRASRCAVSEPMGQYFVFPQT